MPMSRRSCFRWKTLSDSACAAVSPHAPQLYKRTGRTRALYRRMRLCSLTFPRLSQRLYILPYALEARSFLRSRSSLSPMRDPSCLLDRQESEVDVRCKNSVLVSFTVRDQSPSSALMILSLYFIIRPKQKIGLFPVGNPSKRRLGRPE